MRFMSISCCNKICKHFQSTSELVSPNIWQTKRYWKCYECGSIHIEILEPMDIHTHGAKVIDVKVIKPKLKDTQTTLI